MNPRTSLTAVGLVALATLGWPHALVAQSAKVASEGVYTAAQAARGKEAYSKACESCHKADLSGFGDGMAAALSGDDFLKGWTGKSLADLFEKMQTMPPGEETKTTDAARADVLAYVLSANHFREGQTELKPDVAELKPVKIDAPHQ